MCRTLWDVVFYSATDMPDLLPLQLKCSRCGVLAMGAMRAMQQRLNVSCVVQGPLELAATVGVSDEASNLQGGMGGSSSSTA
jgi:hypothetical protein